MSPLSYSTFNLLIASLNMSTKLPGPEDAPPTYLSVVGIVVNNKRYQVKPTSPLLKLNPPQFYTQFLPHPAQHHRMGQFSHWCHIPHQIVYHPHYSLSVRAGIQEYPPKTAQGIHVAVWINIIHRLI